jgi:hypothetical protein
MQSFFGSPHPTSLRNDDKDKDKKKLQGRLGNKEAISAVWWGNSLVFIVAMMVGDYGGITQNNLGLNLS